MTLQTAELIRNLRWFYNKIMEAEMMTLETIEAIRNLREAIRNLRWFYDEIIKIMERGALGNGLLDQLQANLDACIESVENNLEYLKDQNITLLLELVRRKENERINKTKSA